MVSVDDTRDPHGRLIAAAKVSGTAVYRASGQRLGILLDVVIDKQSGQVAYAVLSFGGFLGVGNRYHPIPWSKLRYDPDRGGYVVDIDPSLLESAPAYGDLESVAWNDAAWGRRVHDYYKARPAWDFLA